MPTDGVTLSDERSSGERTPTRRYGRQLGRLRDRLRCALTG
jgi:hypothetical protein